MICQSAITSTLSMSTVISSEVTTVRITCCCETAQLEYSFDHSCLFSKQRLPLLQAIIWPYRCGFFKLSNNFPITSLGNKRLLEGMFETCYSCKPATKKSLSSNNQKFLSSCNQKMSVHVLQQPKNVCTCTTTTKKCLNMYYNNQKMSEHVLQQPKNVCTCTPTTKNSCPHVTKKCLNMYYYNQKSLSFNYKKT